MTGFWNPGNFCWWNLESRTVEFVIQLKESGIPHRWQLESGIQQVPLKGIRNPVNGMLNPQRKKRIQNSKNVLDDLTWGERWSFATWVESDRSPHGLRDDRSPLQKREGYWSRNGLPNWFRDRYWGRARQLLANFFPVLSNSPRSFCKS